MGENPKGLAQNFHILGGPWKPFRLPRFLPSHKKLQVNFGDHTRWWIQLVSPMGSLWEAPQTNRSGFFSELPTYTTLPSHNFHQFAAGTLRIIPGWTQVVIGSPPFIAVMKFGHLEGEQPYLGDLLTGGICPLTNWDDPPSTPILQTQQPPKSWRKSPGKNGCTSDEFHLTSMLNFNCQGT